MAFADLLLGGFCLPVFNYFIISSGYQLSMTNENWKSNVVYNIPYSISLGVSLTSAAFISCERFYAIYWPFRHRRVTVRTYHIFIFISWTLNNVRLTKTLVFASILNLLCWIPLVTVYGIDHESVSIPTRWFVITVALNSCNAFINPLLYAVRVPEFRKALALSCVRKRKKMNPENIKTGENPAIVLSRETHLRACQSESNTNALKFHKNFMETKL
ncbi:unnamed protein product [Pocillopora meandrina]|uniref:G-protein coupled receptors family 1 profile domain-containing protein n=1 Tax=Pocillopora meandrina TaxID=46732 RepID=A0AAU9WPI9_9CNID|nr:unnamed protein product [Pocillopora meandrina]